MTMASACPLRWTAAMMTHAQKRTSPYATMVTPVRFPRPPVTRMGGSASISPSSMEPLAVTRHAVLERERASRDNAFARMILVRKQTSPCVTMEDRARSQHPHAEQMGGPASINRWSMEPLASTPPVQEIRVYANKDNVVASIHVKTSLVERCALSVHRETPIARRAPSFTNAMHSESVHLSP